MLDQDDGFYSHFFLGDSMLQKLPKLLDRQIRIHLNSFQGLARNDLAGVKRHNYSSFIRFTFKYLMTAFLMMLNKSDLFESFNKLFGSDGREMAHHIEASF